MLDVLVIRLINEERERERRVNAMLRATPQPQQPRKVRWVDTIIEESLGDDYSEDSDLDCNVDRSGLSPEQRPPSRKAYSASSKTLDRSGSEKAGRDDLADLNLHRCASKIEPGHTAASSNKTSSEMSWNHPYFNTMFIHQAAITTGPRR
jgi:hypothetical protein